MSIKTDDEIKIALIEELKVSIEKLFCADHLSEEEKISLIREARQIIDEGKQ